MGRTVLMAVLLSAATTLAVASPTVFKPVPGSEYREQIDPPVPVSGLALVGAAIAGVPNPKARQLFVYVGEERKGPLRLRLEMTSADGRFRAHALYEGEASGKQWIALPIEPGEALSKYASQLAVAVRPVDGKSARVDSVHLVSWDQQPAAGAKRTIVLQVNSRRAAMSVRLPGDSDFRNCIQVGTAAAVRFDMVCTVDWTPPAAGRSTDGPAPLLLRRRDGFDESTQRVQLR